jgi:Alw26I/Eco31I/Esp3I family type II restriction m6 adenine DNA methyltransferase
VEEYDYEELQNQLSPNRFPDWSNFRELEWFKSAQTLAEERRFFHWELEFPEAFRSENAGFDVVIGNPPYDVLAEKERREDLSQFMNFIKSSEELNPALGNKIDLYRLMIAKACSIGCNESQLGFIVPMSILADQQTVNLRKYLINSFKIKMIDAFPQKDDPTRRVFPEAKLPTSVIIFEKSHEDYGFFPVITHPGRYLSEISGTYLCDKSLAEMLDKDYFPIPLLSSDLASNILRKLYYRFDWICLIDNLIQTYQGEINETTLASLLSTNAAIGPKVLRGGNVQRYEFLEEARQGIDKYLDVQRYEQQIGGQRVAHTKNPRIGYQRNAALDNWRRLIFTELPSQSYCFDSISYFPITDKKKDYALLALLNSNLFEWRFRLTSTNNHVSTKEIARLPAIRFDYGASDAERTGLVQELKGFYNALCFEEVCSNIEAHLPIDTQGSLIPEKMKLDVVQDFLAFLAEQMLEMNKEKRQEIEGFLTWLEGYVGAKVDDLTPKTRLQTYYDSDFDAFLEVLKKNRKKLAIDPARREPSEALRAEFEGSVSKLSPLRERIEKTAYLIDLIVYRLYGLTNDEIKIVEGGTNAA